MIEASSSSRTSFTGPYKRRVIDQELDDLFDQLPAILLDGPKGVGKTATALQRCNGVRQLDRKADHVLVGSDPYVIDGDPRPTLIDEWQKVPPVFDAVRRLVDGGAGGGSFLLTGSAPTGQTHSGAGRIVTMRMRPLSVFERYDQSDFVSLRGLMQGDNKVRGRCPLELRDYVHEITASGFPGVRHHEERSVQRHIDSYLQRIVDHDLPELGFTARRPATVMSWLRAYGAATSTTASWEKIRNAATSTSAEMPAKSTTTPYIELLTHLRILDPLYPWMPSRNHLSSLTMAPKHHLADPALAARLVKRSTTQLIRGEDSQLIPRDGTFLGGLFESLTALSVRAFAQNSDADVSHLRTQAGRQEIDFIVEGSEGVLGIEAKLTGAVEDRDVRHLLWLREKLGDECVGLVVLHTGPEAYTRRDGVAVVPLGLLGP